MNEKSPLKNMAIAQSTSYEIKFNPLSSICTTLNNEKTKNL